jgi:hypothetical protein
MITWISSILAAGLMLITVSVASAATIHRQVRHHFQYRHQPVIMLLENNPAAFSYSQNEANTETAIRFQEQFDNSY